MKRKRLRHDANAGFHEYLADSLQLLLKSTLLNFKFGPRPVSNRLSVRGCTRNELPPYLSSVAVNDESNTAYPRPSPPFGPLWCRVCLNINPRQQKQNCQALRVLQVATVGLARQHQVQMSRSAQAPGSWRKYERETGRKRAPADQNNSMSSQAATKSPPINSIHSPASLGKLPTTASSSYLTTTKQESPTSKTSSGNSAKPGSTQVLVGQAKQMLAVSQNHLRTKTGNYWSATLRIESVGCVVRCDRSSLLLITIRLRAVSPESAGTPVCR